jgi:hypothetical protein
LNGSENKLLKLCVCVNLSEYVFERMLLLMTNVQPGMRDEPGSGFVVVEIKLA